MRKLKWVIAIFILYSCSSSTPNWILESNHSISPDGKAAIYATNIENDRISVGTWVSQGFASGGAGVFDIETTNESGILLSWDSDERAVIQYPTGSKIQRQEDSSYFAGRMIHFKYVMKN